MIPKIVHYCWFGGAPKSALIKQCMTSWHAHLPEYEFVEWNEHRFDVNANLYVKQAYAARKWAFVSDYVRLRAIAEYGGIYLDTDVEVFRSLDRFLGHGAFTGFENYKGALSPITAVMGAKPHHPWILELLSDYDHATFLAAEGNSASLYTNTRRISTNLVDCYGVRIEDTLQVVGDDLHIYPSHTFCNYRPGSYSMHHFNGSWIPWQYKLRAWLKSTLLARVRKLGA